MIMNPLVVAVVAGALGYAASRRKKPSRKCPPCPPPEGWQPDTDAIQILFGEDCTWAIPDTWWKDVAQPRFLKIIQDTVRSGETWEQQQALIAQLNAKDLTYALMADQVPAQRCPFPSPLADWANFPVGATKSQENMLGLAAHVLQHVEASLGHYVQSKGTKVELPVPLPQIP